MRRLTLLTALLAGLLSACNSSPVAITPVATPPPADSAAQRLATFTATSQTVPFVGIPGLKAVLRSGALAPGATSTH